MALLSVILLIVATTLGWVAYLMGLQTEVTAIYEALGIVASMPVIQYSAIAAVTFWLWKQGSEWLAGWTRPKPACQRISLAEYNRQSIEYTNRQLATLRSQPDYVRYTQERQARRQ